jgi:hypothetical protein
MNLGASYDNAGTRQATKSGAGDGNRTHGSSLGSLGITIIRRPLEATILDALTRRKQIGGRKRKGALRRPSNRPISPTSFC